MKTVIVFWFYLFLSFNVLFGQFIDSKKGDMAIGLIAEMGVLLLEKTTRSYSLLSSVREDKNESGTCFTLYHSIFPAD